ncbi:hypothetical protein ACERK3_01090 [Phycisphaerales bacterium AB-hyl4]|uniref:Uncharacterized protein n=1 Tax=Natronomicrosphaera hydrolytica TaxID=3242702 RepID=A0ABV4U207_9BACT
MMKMLRGFAAIVLTLPLIACGESAEAPERVSYTLTNDTTHEIREVIATGANHHLAFNEVDAGESQTLRGPGLDVPESLTLYWTNHMDQRRSMQLNLRNEVGEDYAGPIRLTVDRRQLVTVQAGR